MTESLKLDEAARRIGEVEERMMFLERDVESLSEVVRAQHDELERRGLEIAALRSRIDKGSGGGVETGSLEEERPPHH